MEKFFDFDEISKIRYNKEKWGREVWFVYSMLIGKINNCKFEFFNWFWRGWKLQKIINLSGDDFEGMFGEKLFLNLWTLVDG